MAGCEITVTLDREPRTYAAGERIAGVVRVSAREDCSCRALAVTLSWRTSGAGDRDAGGERRLQLFSGRWHPGGFAKYPFSLAAPAAPLTYRGNCLTIEWYLRVHADLQGSRDVEVEQEVTIVAGKRHWGLAATARRFAPETGMRRRVRASFPLAVMASLFGAYWLWTGSFPDMSVSLSFGGSGVGLWWLIGRRLASSGLGNISCQVYPLHVRRGDSITCRIRFTPSRDLRLQWASAILSGQEIAVSGRGSDGESLHRRVILRQEALMAHDQALDAGKAVKLERTMSVPPDAPLSFSAPNNGIAWTVLVELGVESWPDWRAEYPVMVRP